GPAVALEPGLAGAGDVSRTAHRADCIGRAAAIVDFAARWAMAGIGCVGPRIGGIRALACLEGARCIAALRAALSARTGAGDRSALDTLRVGWRRISSTRCEREARKQRKCVPIHADPLVQTLDAMFARRLIGARRGI